MSIQLQYHSRSIRILCGPIPSLGFRISGVHKGTPRKSQPKTVYCNCLLETKFNDLTSQETTFYMAYSHARLPEKKRAYKRTNKLTNKQPKTVKEKEYKFNDARNMRICKTEKKKKDLLPTNAFSFSFRVRHRVQEFTAPCFGACKFPLQNVATPNYERTDATAERMVLSQWSRNSRFNVAAFFFFRCFVVEKNQFLEVLSHVLMELFKV